MRTGVHPILTEGRVRRGAYASDESFGHTGAFIIRAPSGRDLRIIASDGTDENDEGWEHVSVSLINKTPGWRDMCFVKDLFWSEDECVVQFHPPQTDYVNNHAHCLHLWKWRGGEFPRPPSILVGVKALGTLADR